MIRLLIIMGFYVCLFIHNTYAFENEEIIAISYIGDKYIKTGIGKIIHKKEHQVDPMLLEKKFIKNKKFKNPSIEIVTQRDVTIEFAFTENKHFIREISNDNFPIVEDVRSFDGEKLSVLRYIEGADGLIKPSGFIDSPQNIKNFGFDPISFFSILGTPVATFLKGEEVKYKKEESIDNVLCMVFSRSLSDSDKNTNVWLAPDYMYRPIKIEFITSESKIVINNSYAYFDSILFLKTVLIENYSFDENSKKWIYTGYNSYTFQDECMFNMHVTNDTFSNIFPKGMSVLDKRINVINK